MLHFVAAAWVSQSGSHPDAAAIVRQMLEAFQSVYGIEMTFESDLTFDGRKVPYTAIVRADANRYWAKTVGGAPIGTQFVAWDGKKLLYTGDDGNRAESPLSELRVMVNQASAPAYYGWKVFFDRDKYRAALKNGALYIHPEAIEGHMCDVVAVANSSVTGAEERAAVQYLWIDRESHLPRAYQLHSFGRGQEISLPKMQLEDLKLNPTWASGAFSDVPSHVVVASAPREVSTSEPVGLKAGARLPDLSVQDLHFRRVPLRSLIAGRTVVAFWAPWCGPCQEELKALQTLPEVKSGALKVVAISVFDSKQNAANFVKTHSMPYTVVIDPDCERSTSALASVFGVSAIPHAFLCDGAGTVLREWIGFSDVKQLAMELKG